MTKRHDIEVYSYDGVGVQFNKIMVKGDTSKASDASFLWQLHTPQLVFPEKYRK